MTDMNGTSQPGTTGAVNGTDAIPNLDIVFAVLNIAVGVSSIVMNFLVLFVYVKLNPKHPTYFLFINITFHDAVSGITGIYMGVFLFSGRPLQLTSGIDLVCQCMGFLWSFTAFTTPFLLCIASLFRFMAIYMPYSYRDTVTIRNAAIGVITGWTIGLVSTLVPLFYGVNYQYHDTSSVCDVDLEKVKGEVMIIFILVPLLVPLCILMLCNGAVLVHLCKCTGTTRHKSKSGDIQLHEQPLTTSSHNSSAVPQFGAICEWKTKVPKKDYHTATTVVLMTLNYILCYGVWIAYFMTRSLTSDPDTGEDTARTTWSQDPTANIYLDALIKLMACLNSALNGVVHIARGSQIRLQIGRLFALVAFGNNTGSDNHNHGVHATTSTQANSRSRT